MRIAEVLTLDHCRCDALFAKLEHSAHKGEWSRLAQDFEAFQGALEQHFQAEENEIFPALTAANAMWRPPTDVMRHEHQEMRALVEDLIQAMSREDAESFSAIAETLLFTRQVHNAKEENVLYRMIDDALGPRDMKRLKQIEDQLDGTQD